MLFIFLNYYLSKKLSQQSENAQRWIRWEVHINSVFIIMNSRWNQIPFDIHATQMHMLLHSKKKKKNAYASQN